MPELVPAILSTTKKDALTKLKKIRGLAKRAQFDFMDGKFVKQKTILPKELPKLKTKMHLEAHLMMKNPAEQAELVARRGFKTALFHIEACKTKNDCLNTISAFKKQGLKAGIALNPETPAKKAKPFAKKVDEILVMTVHPGKMGQKLIPECLKKIRQLKKWTSAKIEVDGGINEKTAQSAVLAGAELLVAGSAVFGEKNINKAVKKMKKAIKCTMSS